MEQTEAMEWETILINYGFPALMTFWFMFRMEKKFEDNTKALNDMTVAFTKLCDKIGETTEKSQ